MSTGQRSDVAPLVTVVTTAHNAAPFLDEAIESVLAQTFTDWEYVVVDDASQDETPEIIAKFADADSRFRVIRRARSEGPYAAANAGFAQARGRFVARLDADDIWLPYRLERQVRFMERHPRLRACAAYVMILANDRVRPQNAREVPVSTGSLRWALCVRGFMPSTTLIEKDAFDEIGGFVELPASQDHRLWCDLARRRWLGAVPEVLAYWRSHERQISVERRVLQERLAVEIVQEHLSALTGEAWADEDIRYLRFIGRPDVPTWHGFRVIRRFDRSWRTDGGLTAVERAELARLTRRLRAEHVRTVIGSTVRSTPGGAELLRAVRAHARSSRES